MKIAIDAASPDRRTRIACLNGILEGLVIGNMQLMQRGEPIAPLYASGVRYKREPRVGPWWLRERWLYCTQVLAERFGDCEDLAAWRAAELRLVHAEPARAILIPSGPRTLHAIVIRGNGMMEDPSRVLGMGAHGMAPEDPHATPPSEAEAQEADSEADPTPPQAAPAQPDPFDDADPLDGAPPGHWPWRGRTQS